jgi:phosphoglycerate dehydrogenase-like enzyme
MNILFCGDTFPAAREYLRERLPAQDHLDIWSKGDLNSQVANADVVIPLMHRIDAGVMDSGRFRLIQQWGSGLEGVDLDAARRRGIWVSNVPHSEANAESVAEHAILLMLCLLRNLRQAESNVRSGILGAPLGRTLFGRTVCLYGLGGIAASLARRLRPLGARIVGLTRDPKAPKVAAFNLDECYATSEWHRCLPQTDILVVCLRLSDATRNMIGAKELTCLPAGALLVNVARGGIVDYGALCAALSTGHLAGAGLDVYWQEPICPDDPILKLPNVIATPHIAGVTDRSYTEIANVVAGNIERLRRGEPPIHLAT